MLNKGVSGIIAAILLVVIVIALVGVSYLYFSGLIQGKTEKTISISDIYCTSTPDIVAVVSNDGTSSMNTNELTVFVDGTQDASVTFNPAGTLTAHNTTTITDIDQGVSIGNTYTVLIVSPGGSARREVNC